MISCILTWCGSQFSVNWVLILPIIFRKKWMQYSLPSACLRSGANTMPCNQVLAGVAVLLLGKRHDPLNSKTDKFWTRSSVCFKPLGAEPETQEVLSECSAAQLCSKLWYHHSVLGPVPTHHGAPGERRVESWRPRKLFLYNQKPEEKDRTSALKWLQ